MLLVFEMERLRGLEYRLKILGLELCQWYGTKNVGTCEIVGPTVRVPEVAFL